MRSAAIAIAVGVVLALNGCARLRTTPCAPGAESNIHDVLYFGLATPDGAVSAQDWSDFLTHSVTPRFPDGLTSWPASGQWRSADGTLLHEDSRVLNLIHADDPASERAIEALIADYKTRFKQEAVLRVRTAACVSF